MNRFGVGYDGDEKGSSIRLYLRSSTVVCIVSPLVEFSSCTPKEDYNQKSNKTTHKHDIL